jgi:hypothetical protein
METRGLARIAGIGKATAWLGRPAVNRSTVNYRETSG